MSKQLRRGASVATAVTLTAGALTWSATAAASPSAPQEGAPTSTSVTASPRLVLVAATAAPTPTATPAATATPRPTATTPDPRASTVQRPSRTVARPAVAPRAVFTLSLGRTSLAAVRTMAPARFGTSTYSRWYAKQAMATRYRWGYAQYKALDRMWYRESHWLYQVRSRSGRYIGIPQTSAAVIRSAGFTVSAYRRSPEIQIQVGLRYIKGRYGTPARAWAFWQRHHWY